MTREIRNPKSHRHSDENDRKTHERVEQYYGVCALLATWEAQSPEVQRREHDYIIRLRAKVRTVKNYLLHRADAKVNV